MYLQSTRTYYKGTAQHAARAPFLILLQVDRGSPAATCNQENMFAVVRQVALRQVGHWMMGRAYLDEWRSMSGGYGNDGLPVTVKALPRDAVKVPPYLYEAWNKGGGHNSAGAEAPAMRAWARVTWPDKFK